jgi:hypothetical protein
MQNVLESYWESGSHAPGLHAFLIGVSSYPFAAGGEREVADTYGIGQLTSPASTVAHIATWLLQNSASLAFPHAERLAPERARRAGAHGVL